MKKIIAAALCVVFAVMLVLGIMLANSNQNYVNAEVTTYENAVHNPRAFIVRNEKTYYAESAGTIYDNVTEGKRVAADTLIGTIYTGDVSSEVLKELSTVDDKINKQINENSESKLYTVDSMSAESEIQNKITDILEADRGSDISKISGYKQDIYNLRNGIFVDGEENLDGLYAQKREIEGRIGGIKKEIYTEISGMFSTYIDGLESVLNPSKIENYTVSYIENLNSYQPSVRKSDSVAVGEPLFKVVNNHEWYVLTSADAAVMSQYKEGTSVKVRFNSFAGEVIDGNISYISGEENGKALVFIKCETYLESAFSFRTADIDLIFESYTGYKVPRSALHVLEDRNVVVAARETTMYNCAVDVVYENKEEGFLIVESPDGAENKLSMMDRIMYDESTVEMAPIITPTPVPTQEPTQTSVRTSSPQNSSEPDETRRPNNTGETEESDEPKKTSKPKRTLKPEETSASENMSEENNAENVE